MSIEELKDVLRPTSETPRLLPGTILHTDSAKAYRRVGPQRWPEPGALHDADVVQDDPDFAPLNYVHTLVVHKKKPGQEVHYTALRRVRLADGTEKEVLGGTQKIDGYWATLRREVGKKSYNTGAKGSEKRRRLEMMVRTHQWFHWNLHRDRFTLLGELYKRFWEKATFEAMGAEDDADEL